MDLNLDIDYVVDDADRKNPIFATNSLISIFMLRTGLNAVKGGVDGSPTPGHKNRAELRIAARVVNAITRAKNSGATVLKFADIHELKHVRDGFKSWLETSQGVPQSTTGWYEDLTSAIEKLVDESEKKVEEKVSK